MKFRMSTEKMFQVIVLAVSVLSFIPLELSATTDFGGNEVYSLAATVMKFIFGPMVHLAAVFGGGYGVLQAILTSSIKPLGFFAAIAVGVNILPKFIENVYPVSTLLLP